MSNIYFVHGWGFDPRFWGELSEFGGNHIDLGFYGAPAQALPSEPTVYITHSMGLTWLLQQEANIKGLVVVNGFTKFCADEGFQHGIAPRALSRMVRQFAKSPEAVWTDFMTKCGLANPTLDANADNEILQDGLKKLGEWDVRDLYAKLDVPKMVLASDQDQIIPKELSTACFGGDIHWAEGGDHLLPLSNPAFVSQKIRNLLSLVS